MLLLLLFSSFFLIILICSLFWPIERRMDTTLITSSDLNTQKLVNAYDKLSTNLKTSDRVEMDIKIDNDLDTDDYESLPQNSSTSVHLSAGAIAGIMEHCIVYPIDSVKVSLQDPFILLLDFWFVCCFLCGFVDLTVCVYKS